METDYSKREIDHFMNDIRQTLARIEAQTIKHNGRLTRLERWVWAIGGATAVLSWLYVRGGIDFTSLFS